MVAVASDAGSVMCFDITTNHSDMQAALLCSMEGHGDAVQAVQFDPYGKFMISAGSDNTFRTWH